MAEMGKSLINVSFSIDDPEDKTSIRVSNNKIREDEKDSRTE